MVAVGTYIQQILLLFTIKGVLAQWPGPVIGEAMLDPSAAANLLGVEPATAAMLGAGVGMGGGFGMEGAGRGLGPPGLISLDTIAEYNEVPVHRRPLAIQIAEQQWRARLRQGMYGGFGLNPTPQRSGGFGINRFAPRSRRFGFNTTTVTDKPRRYKYPDKPNGQPVPTGPDKNAWKKMKRTFDRTLKAFPDGLKPINRNFINEAVQHNNGVQQKHPVTSHRTRVMPHSRPLYSRNGRLPAPASSLVPRFRSSHARLNNPHTPTPHRYVPSHPAHQRTHQQTSTLLHARQTRITKTEVNSRVESAAQRDLSKGSPLSPSIVPPGGSMPVRLSNTQSSPIANTANQLRQTPLTQTSASYPSGKPSLVQMGPQGSSANVQANVSLQGISQANTKPNTQVLNLGRPSTQPGVYDLRGVKAPSVGYTPLISSSIGNFAKKQPNIESMRQAVQNGENLSVSPKRNTSAQSKITASASPSENKTSPLDALTQAAEGPSLPHLNPLDKTQNSHIRSGIPHNIETVPPPTSVPQLGVYERTRSFYDPTQGTILGNFGTQAWGYGQTTNAYGTLYQTTPIMTQSPYDQYPYTTNSPLNAGSQYDQYPYNGNSQMRQTAYQEMATLRRQQRYYEQQQVIQQKQRLHMDQIRQQQLLAGNRQYQTIHTPTPQIKPSVNTLKKSEKVPKQVKINTTVQLLTTQPQPQTLLTTGMPPTTLSAAVTMTTTKTSESASVSTSNRTTMSIQNETTALSNTESLSPSTEKPNLWGGNPPPPPMEQDRMGIRPDHVEPNPDPYTRISQASTLVNNSGQRENYIYLVNQASPSDTTTNNSEKSYSPTSDPPLTSMTPTQVDNETATEPNISVSLSTSTETILTSTMQTQTNPPNVTSTKPDISVSTEHMLTQNGTLASSTTLSSESQTTVPPLTSTERPVTVSQTKTTQVLPVSVTKQVVNGTQRSVNTSQNTNVNLHQDSKLSQRWVAKTGVDHHHHPTVPGQSLVLAQKGFHPPASSRLSPSDQTELNRGKVPIPKEHNNGILKLHQKQILSSSSASAFSSFGQSRQSSPIHRTFNQNRLSHGSQSTLRSSPLPQRGTNLSGQNVNSHVRPHFSSRPMPQYNAAAPLSTQPRLPPQSSQRQINTVPPNERIPYRYPGMANSPASRTVDVNTKHVRNDVRQSSLTTSAFHTQQNSFRHQAATGHTGQQGVSRLTGHHAALGPARHTAGLIHGHRSAQGHPATRRHPTHPRLPIQPTGHGNTAVHRRTARPVPSRAIGRQVGVTRRFAGSPTAQRLAGRPVTHGLAGHRSSHTAPGHLPALQSHAAQGHGKASAKSSRRPIGESSLLRIMQKGFKQPRGALIKELTYNIRDETTADTNGSTNSMAGKDRGQLAIALSKGLVLSSSNQSMSNTDEKVNHSKQETKEMGVPLTNTSKLMKSTETNTSKKISPTMLPQDLQKSETTTNDKSHQSSTKFQFGNLVVVQSLTNRTSSETKTHQQLPGVYDKMHGILTVQNHPSDTLHEQSMLPHASRNDTTSPYSETRKYSSARRIPTGTLNVAQFVHTTTTTARKVASMAHLATSRPVPASTRLSALRPPRVSPLRQISHSLRQSNGAGAQKVLTALTQVNSATQSRGTLTRNGLPVSTRVNSATQFRGTLTRNGLPVSTRVNSATQSRRTLTRNGLPVSTRVNSATHSRATVTQSVLPQGTSVTHNLGLQQQSSTIPHEKSGQKSPLLFSRVLPIRPLQRASRRQIGRASVSPIQRASVSPIQRASVSPIQRASVSPIQRTPLSTLQRARLGTIPRAPVTALHHNKRPAPRMLQSVQISTPNINPSTHSRRQTATTTSHSSHVHTAIGARSTRTSRHL